MMAGLLAACGGTSDSKETTAAASGGKTEGYTFTYKGTTLYMGQDASVLEKLGDYKDYSETPSCAFEGNDKQYYYGSFYVCVGTLNGKELIDNIWFADDTVETDEGLCIGDSKDKVEELYGADGFNGINAYVYEKDGHKLTIIINSDEVSSIQYGYN